MPLMKDKDVARVAQMLKAAVRFSGISHRKIEREMELSTGYLSRILSGKVELRIQHVLGVCRAIGLPPSAFFEAAYPSREMDPETARLVAALQELLPAEDAPPRAKVSKTVPTRPPAAARKTGKQAQETATSQLRRLLEAVLIEMEEQGEDYGREEA
jgi:transcriptional regulator with XRE-family HTH domain